MTLTLIVSFAIVIAVMVFFYEKQIKKLHDANNEKAYHVMMLVESGQELIKDYEIMLEILREQYTEEEINEKFTIKSKELEEKRND
jgi:hypothetical protein